MGLNISPCNLAILSCLQSRKYCEAVMDNLLLFTPTKSSHFQQARRFVEGFAQKWIENFPKEVSTIQN